MRILVLESSGNRKGSSNLLASSFVRGALENGHDVVEFDVFRADIRPCLGCNRCGMNGPCVQRDAYETHLKGMIRQADMLVFVMPVYYYNWPAKLKAVVDRFYSFTGELTSMHKKTALIAAAWDTEDSAFEIVTGYYRKLCEYMEFEDKGVIAGKGCGTPEKTAKSFYAEEAYRLGVSL